jgi:hypothetical protein
MAATAASVTHHPPGESAEDLRVGDVLLTGIKAQGVVTSAACEKRRALGRGVVRSPISKYAPADYAWHGFTAPLS